MNLHGEILVLSNTFAATPVACDYLAKNGYQVVIPPKLAPVEKDAWLEAAMKKSSAVIVGHDRIDRHLIENSPLLKVIAKQGVGLDNIDTQAANEHQVRVLTAAGGNSDSVADLAMLLILAVSRKVIPANNMVRQGGWDRVIGHEVWNKNLGLVGFGEIGQRVARRAKGFSMSIAYYDIMEYPEAEQSLGAAKMDLPDLLSWADYVSLHLPLNPQTAKIVNGELLSLMKQTACLINTSRGGVIDETALYDSLVNHRIAGAGLDVFEKEPPTDLALVQLANVVATPHMAAYTTEAIERVSMQVAQSVIDTLQLIQ
ncbi:MAG: phosphoglycerate dehydrogenase [Anaerolineaceae bacterium]